MKNAELEFEDEVKIHSTVELLIVNIKAKKIAESEQYDIKIVMKCPDRNRSKSANFVDELKFDQDFKIVLLNFMNKEGVLAKLKLEIAKKLIKDFKYDSFTE